MPFQVFRRHQKKMLGVLAIMAMFAFIVADSSTRLLDRDWSGSSNPVVVKLNDRKIRRADLAAMQQQRVTANNVLGQLLPALGPQVFGETTTPALVDAIILQQKADELGMRADPNTAKEWIFNLVNRYYDQFRLMGLTDVPEDSSAEAARMLEEIYNQYYRDKMTDTQLLSEIANQIRLLEVLALPGEPLVTPLDAFEAYRQQREFVAVTYVPFRTRDALRDITQTPSEAELEAFFEKHKDVVADPVTGKPGFRLPKRVRVEFLTIDVPAIDRELREKTPRSEVVKVYREQIAAEDEARLPVDLFANDPDALRTPPPKVFEDEFFGERVEEQLERLIDPVKDEMLTYADSLAESEDDSSTRDTSARRPDLAAIAKAKPAHLQHTSVLLSRDLAEQAISAEPGEALALHGIELSPELVEAVRGAASSAQGESSSTSRSRTFLDDVFAAAAPLFDILETRGQDGRFYVTWRTEELPAESPTFARARPQVERQWRLEQARDLAKKRAEEFAARAETFGGDLSKAAEGQDKVPPPATTFSRPRVERDLLTRSLRPSDLFEFPNATDTLRERLFGLGEKTVAVEPDESRSVYYVLALNRRDPISFETYMGPYGVGQRSEYESTAMNEARAQLLEDWLADLRAEAGLPEGWKPPEAEDSFDEG